MRFFVEFLDSPEELFHESSSLLRRCLWANVFHSPAFALPALPPFGSGVVCYCVRDAHGVLVGVFLGRKVRRLGQLYYESWVHDFAPLGLPLVDRDFAREVFEAFFYAAGVEGLILPQFIQGLGFEEAFSGFQSSLIAVYARPMLKVGSPLAVSAEKRSQFARLRRRYASLRFERFHGVTAFERALPIFLDLELRSWKGRRGTAISQSAKILSFVQSALSHLAVQDDLMIDVLFDGEIPVAALVLLASNRTVFFWKIAHDEAYSALSPGVQLLVWSSQQLDAERFDIADSCITTPISVLHGLWPQTQDGGLLILSREGGWWVDLLCKVERQKACLIKRIKRVMTFLLRRR